MTKSVFEKFRSILTGASKNEKDSDVLKVFANIPQLETQRLRLRKIALSDSEDMFEYASDPELTRYLTWTPHVSLAHTMDYLKYVERQYELGKFYDWGLELKEEGKFIGTCGFTSISLSENKGEIGYVLNKRYWGCGLVPEAVRKVLDFGFYRLKLEKIEARFMDGNTASCRVMQKCGMKYESTLHKSMYVKGEMKNIHVFSIDKNEFTINEISRKKPDGQQI
ncbi:MAG: GNAT family N-acetyltransferase [Eubacteriales bacterium]